MGYALRRLWLPQRVATLLWNQWQLCRGMHGKFAMESVASLAWNRWQLSYGTGGNFRAEYANASNRVESVSFAEPGTYLVICNIRGHFLDGMYAFIHVLR